jgi:hypothetical protein
MARYNLYHLQPALFATYFTQISRDRHAPEPPYHHTKRT